MNIDTAEWCHNELRENLPGPSGDARDALDDVIMLHAPEFAGAHAGCKTCLSAYEGGVQWPCPTIVAINAYAHVDLSTP